MTQHDAMDRTGTTGDQAVGRLTPQAVRDGTGREWAEWLELLDTAGAPEWDHRGVVDFLEREHPEVSAWWQQSLAVAYERARGKRVVGQTAGVGFQIGAQRSVAAPLARVWKVLITQPEIWLGAGASAVFEPGRQYEVPPGPSTPGVRGEIRVVKHGDRLRMTWQPDDWPAPATLQVTVTPTAPGRTRLNAHLEKLPDARIREVMREHMHAAMERVAQAAEGE